MSEIDDAPTTYVRYHAGIESPPEGEQEAIDGIIATMTSESRKVANREGSAVRASHAKTSGVLKGEFVVHGGLAPELAQGLFARPGRYDALVRLAQGPGEHLSDRVSTHRGMSVKLFGVAGDKLDGHTQDTQDFVLATGPVFPDPDAASFLKSMRMIEKHVDNSETAKAAVSTAARMANTVVKAVTGSDVPVLDFFGHKPLHPVAESYHSQAALRFGFYVAKVAIFPTSPEQLALSGKTLDPKSDPNVFRDATANYFGTHAATFEFRVQLCTDLDTMPVEDASKQWPESESPYVTVATLTLAPQNVLSPERVRYVEEVLSFRPAHSLVEHRPLGSLMRARLQVYTALSAFRHGHNQVTETEPTGLDAIPD
ncbi:MAG: catalase family protein [Janthinobacterium lividum]